MENLRDHHRQLLSMCERQRADAILVEDARLLFLLGAVLLRLVLADALGVAPGDVPILRDCAHCGGPHGRPRVPDAAVDVSVTHAGDVAAVALTANGPVGVDIERDSPDGVDALLDAVLGPEEASVASASQFLRVWTRKESVVKATGDGLSIPLTAVVLGEADGRPFVRSYGRTPMTASLHDLQLAPGYTGAVTVLSPDPVDVDIRDATGLLDRLTT